MKVLVVHVGIDIKRFSMELHNFDIVLAIKEKIARALRIPVNQQTLFFNGGCLLYDDLNVTQCNIVENSLLELYIFSWMNKMSQSLRQQIIHGHDLLGMARLLELDASSWSCNKSQVLHQTQQYPVPSNLTQQIIQDLSALVRSNNSQVLRPTQQSPVPLYLPQQIIQGQDLPAMVRSNNGQMLRQTQQCPVLSNSTQQIVRSNNCQGCSVMVGIKNNQVLQREQSPESDDSVTQVMVDQVLHQTEQSLQMSHSVKERISTVKSSRPMKQLTVMVKLFQEYRKIPVEVYAGDKVEELRNELAKIQERGELILPQNGYIFIHKQNVLDDDRPFWWNLVTHGDTIEILGEPENPPATASISQKRSKSSLNPL